jgi:hypothetical protein
MKKIAVTLITALILAGCADKKKEQKVALDDILKVHDKVMGSDEQLMKNKMQLDTLLKQGKAGNADTAKMLSKQLNAAETNMETWMHDFDPEHKGKTDQDNVNYMNIQKKQIMAVDSQINVAITASNQYLLKLQKK